MALREQKIFRTGWQTDLKHFFVSHAGVQLLSFATLIPVQVAVRLGGQLDRSSERSPRSRCGCSSSRSCSRSTS